MPKMRRISLFMAVLAALACPALASGASALERQLGSAIRGAGSQSGAYVMDTETNATVFALRDGRARILASNTKLFTTAAARVKYGPEGRFDTEVLGDGGLGKGAVYLGDLYLRGGGDPTFGSRAYTRRTFGSGAEATVEELAASSAAGIVSEPTGTIWTSLGDRPALAITLSSRVCVPAPSAVTPTRRPLRSTGVLISLAYFWLTTIVMPGAVVSDATRSRSLPSSLALTMWSMLLPENWAWPLRRAVAA